MRRASWSCSRHAERFGSKMSEAFAGLLKQFPSDIQVDKRRFYVLMPEVSSKVWKSRLRIDAITIPFEHAVADHRVPKIMDSRTEIAMCRLESGTTQHLRQQVSNRNIRVAACTVMMAEQAVRCAHRRSRFLARLKIALQ